MLGAVPPDFAATFFGVIDEDAVVAAVDAERVAEREELEQDSRAELEGVDQAGEEVVRMREEAEAGYRRADDVLQWMELERCLYLVDAATCRARAFCLILAKRAASGGGSIEGRLPAELWLHCAVMLCPITTVQKWVRCQFADWVVASNEKWHHGYDGLLYEYQRALSNGATDLKCAPRKLRQHLYKPTARLMELESVLSHDEWEPVDNRDELWAELAELLVRHPHLRTILTVPDEAMAEADITFRDWWLVDSYEDDEDVWAQQSGVINKWEYAERTVTRRSWGKIPHWDAHCEVPNFAYLLRQNRAAWPLFDDNNFVNGDVPAIKMLRCLRDGFPADMNAAAAAYFGCFDAYVTVHCSLADLFAVDWDVSRVPPPNTVAALN